MKENKKVVFFAFQGEKMCFTHLLLNAIDMHEKGMDARIVIEGKATKLIPVMIEEENPLFQKVRELDLIDSVCRACSMQMGVLEFVETETDLPLNGELKGHPPMAPYFSNGYEMVIL